MPSNRERRDHEEEANTTLRHHAHQLVKAKWSTKFKIWVGTVSAGVPLLIGLFAGVQWINQNVAWAEDLKKSYVLQTIQVSQLRTEDRMWKVKHDLKEIASRKLGGNSLDTDELDQKQLLSEYEFLLGQKEKWNNAEKEAIQ